MNPDDGAPRVVLDCSAPGCTATWWQFGRDHARTIRRAVIGGWTGSSRRGGCLCIDDGARCPDHPRVS